MNVYKQGLSLDYCPPSVPKDNVGNDWYIFSQARYTLFPTLNMSQSTKENSHQWPLAGKISHWT